MDTFASQYIFSDRPALGWTVKDTAYLPQDAESNLETVLLRCSEESADCSVCHEVFLRQRESLSRSIPNNHFALPALFGGVEPYRLVVQACSWYRSRGVMKPQKPYPVSVALGSVCWIATKVTDTLLLYVLLMRNYRKTSM